MTVNSWERNRCKLRLYLIPKILQFLGYNPFPTTEQPTLGEAIKEYRSMHGLSQKKLTKVLGFDTSTLSSWEKRNTKPSRELREEVWTLLAKRTSGK